MSTSNGAFDDLVPKSAGRFDDLAQDGAFDDLVPQGDTVSRTTGFWDNLDLTSPNGGAFWNGFVPRGIRHFLYGDDRPKAKPNPFERELNQLSMELDELEEQGQANSDLYKAKEAEFYATLDASEQEAPPSGPVLSALVDAFKEDAGAVTADFTEAMLADPQLMVVPAGWAKAAAAAGKVGARYGKVSQVSASMAGGASGAAATGAAITVPISVMEQLEEEGEVDVGRVIEDAKFAGALSIPFAGLFHGVSNMKRIKFEREPFEAMEPAHQSAGAAAAVHPTSTLGEAIKQKFEKVPEIMRDLLEVGGYKAITKLDRAARLSPSFKKIRDALEYTEFSDTPIGPSFFERVYMANGKYLTRLQDQMEQLGTKFSRRISTAKNNEVLRGLRGEIDFEGAGKGGVTHGVVKELRKLLDDVHDYATKAGLEPGYLKGFFPRVYRASVLRTEKGRDGMTEVLMKNGIDAVEADEIVSRIVRDDGVFVTPKRTSSRVLDEDGGITPGRIGQSSTSKNPHLENSRKLAHIPDSELAPFLESNVYDVLKKYTAGVVRRAEYARSFGQGEGKVNDLLRKAITEAVDNGGAIKRSEIKRVYDLLDAIQHRYNPIESRAMRQANKGIGAYQLLRTLSLATISSLAEPLIILSRGRISSTLKAVPQVIAHASNAMVRSVFKKFPKAEATRAVEAVGVGLDLGVTERLMASFGGETTRMTEKFFKATLLHQWTRLNRVAGFHSGRQMIADNLRSLSRGVKGAKQKRFLQELTELGIDPEEGIDWLRRGAPTDDPFSQQLDAGALRFVNEVVMDPRATNRPMWHSNPHFHLLSQLKGFQTVFGNTVMKRFLHQVFNKGVKEGGRNAAKYASVGTLMIMVGMIANDFREYLKYGPEGNPKFKNETGAERLLRAVDRVGFTGASQMAVDAMFAYRFGSSGVSQVLGPAVSQLDQLAFKAIPEAMDGRTSKLETELTNAIPILNANKPARNWTKENIVSPAVEAITE